MSDESLLSKQQLTADSLMTKDVFTVTVEMKVKDAIGLLINHKISGAPVIDSLKKVISVVTERDLMSLAASPGLNTPIGQCLDKLTKSENLVTLKRTCSFSDLYRKFLATPVHRIFIVDDVGHILGLVSRSDVLRVLYGPQAGTETKSTDVFPKVKKTGS